MVDIDTKKIQEIFDYMNKPTEFDSVQGTIVFGRADPLLAEKAGELYAKRKSGYFLFTGGVGKDSGDLAVSEAEYLGNLAIKEFGVPSDVIYLETRASNGAENCVNSLDVILREGLEHDLIALLAHTTSSRRLAGMMDVMSRVEPYGENFGNTRFERVTSGYYFDPLNAVDQKEVIEELLRMANWPSQKNEDGTPFLFPQSDLPWHLVDYAKKIRESLD
ncbi:MAG: ElyC/SanA/YdcF family protein [archaeon]